MSHEGYQSDGIGSAYRLLDGQHAQQLSHSLQTVIPGREQLQSHAGNGVRTALWNRNAPQDGVAMTYSPTHHEQSASAQPQYIHPQALHPGQLTKQSAPTPYQHAPRPLATPPSRKISGLPSAAYGGSGESDKSLLLISLAEEYLQAAHRLVPSMAMSKGSRHVEEYQKLVATALTCFDATLKKTRPQPRVEANVRLRYASLLYEETSNCVEAEVCLGKGIKLCEMYNYYDLKYAMQFMLAQAMFKTNPKAATIALDSNIEDAEAYHHTSWIYAMRFLRASFAITCGTAADNHTAVQNLKIIAERAMLQGDRAIHRLSSLMEAMVHLKSATADALESADRCMGAAWAYQLDTDQTPQLRALTHIVDLACSLRRNKPQVMGPKCKEMQVTMDEILKSNAWGSRDELFSVPINSTMRDDISTVSYDTRMILGIGDDGRDALMMSFLSQRDAYAICSLLSGVVMSRHSAIDGKCHKFNTHGLEYLEQEVSTSRIPGGSLATYIARQKWRGQIRCLLQASIVLNKSQTCDWDEVGKSLDLITSIMTQHELSGEDSLGSFMLYLRAIYFQGTGQLEQALQIFHDSRFDLSTVKSMHSGSTTRIDHDLSILSALNTLWILQHPSYQDTDRNVTLLALLAPHCETHTDPDFRTAYHILQASVPTNAPVPIHITKNFLGAAFNGSQATSNAYFLCLTFSLMCGSFFATNVGEQAEKSALVAQMQARKSGSKLWRSVTDGLLAKCYEGQGKRREADETFREGVRLADEAMGRGRGAPC